MAAIHTLLACDLVDSTGTTQRVGELAARALWADHDRRSRELLQRWRGHEIDRSDGFLLVFEACVDAAQFALAYHEALASLPEPVQARVAIHSASVALHRNAADDVLRGAKPVEIGDWLAKARVARVMSLARAGQTLATAAAAEALRDSGLQRQAHGHWHLQGIDEPEEVFEIGTAATAFAPPADAPKAWRVVHRQGLWLPAREIAHSLPAERDAFIGRRFPLRELAQRFDDSARLVSLLGPGGIGKTRLAKRFGWLRLGDFPGGVWFADLSQALTLDGVVHAVAQALDVPLGGGEPVARLGNAIAARGRCLVILDNFEQVAALAEATLGAWLERAAEARYVVTSREVLGIVGEQTMVLDPLSTEDAVALFVHRGEAARTGFVATPDDEQAVQTLVQMLDRLPLAIELAAARARILSPPALLSRMSQRFELLASRAGRHERQSTLRATLDWSWDLLSQAERSALAQVSVFHGSFSLDAAVHTLSTPGGEPAIELLQALVDKSLVRPLAGDRFELLNSVREYAAERLRTPGSVAGSGPAAEQAALDRHEAYYTALAPVHVEAAGGIDLDNLIAVCRRAAARGAAAPAARALEGAWAALRLRGPFRAGVELAQRVLDIEGADLGERALAHHVAGRALQSSGQFAAARAPLAAALSEARERGDRAREAAVLSSMAECDLNTGRMASAGALFREALGHARTLSVPALECELLNGLGTHHENLGELESAAARYADALALARRHGLRRWEGGALGNLGQVRANQGRAAEARSAYAEALQIARELGDRQWEGNTLCNLGLLEFTEGRLDAAAAHLAQSIETARRIGHLRLECVVECNLGLVRDAAGQSPEAERHFEAALRIARELGDPRSEGQVLGYLGLVCARQGRVAAGRAQVAAAAALLQAVSDRLSLGVLRCLEAEVEWLGDDRAAAAAALREAEAIAADVEPGTGSEFAVALEKVRALLQARALPAEGPPNANR